MTDAPGRVVLTSRLDPEQFVGLIMMLVGALFVFGAVYVKTHRVAIGDKANVWRKRFREWE